MRDYEQPVLPLWFIAAGFIALMLGVTCLVTGAICLVRAIF